MASPTVRKAVEYFFAAALLHLQQQTGLPNEIGKLSASAGLLLDAKFKGGSCLLVTIMAEGLK